MDSFVTLNDGARLWTFSAGAGPPVVLLNGGPGMPDYLAPVAALLEESFRVHRFEPRGCGRSPKADRYTLTQSIADIEELRAHWGYERWSVVGHSWGVDLGLGYALTAPARVAALAGVAGGRIHNDRAWSETYQQNKHCEQDLAEGPPNLAVNAILMDQWRAFCRAPNLLSNLARLQTPTLFITGADDIRPSWGTVQLGRLMPAARHIELAGADHYPWRHRPRELASALLGFLESHATP